MTIAIGMLCDGGVIVAADTQLTWQDERTDYGPKVYDLVTDTASFVIAISANDVEAAATFVSEVKKALLKPIRSISAVENSIKEMMKKWNSSFRFREDRTDVSFLLGVRIKEPIPEAKDMNGLFFCELPFTVSRKTIENAKGYIAIGCGRPASDSLFNVLFGTSVAPHACLCRISYLMNRAKQEFRSGCGGDTDAVFLRAEHEKPLWIERYSMAQAESFGRFLDEALAKTASFVIPSETSENFQPFVDFAGDLQGKGLLFRRLQFKAKTGEIIA